MSGGPPDVSAEGAASKKASKGPPVDAEGRPLVGDQLVAHHLRAQSRLRGVVVEVTYTDAAEGLGNGVIQCADVENRLMPFSCRNISLERNQLRIAAPGDLCTLKLSCRGQEVRATSIRLKGRRPTEGTDEISGATSSEASPQALKARSGADAPSPVGSDAPPASHARAPTAEGAESRSIPKPRRDGVDPNALFDGDSPLNAFEYAAAATTGLSAGAGSSYGLSPHPAGPPQWPGSMPWSAMEPQSMPRSLPSHPHPHGALGPLPPSAAPAVPPGRPQEE